MLKRTHQLPCNLIKDHNTGIVYYELHNMIRLAQVSTFGRRCQLTPPCVPIKSGKPQSQCKTQSLVPCLNGISDACPVSPIKSSGQ